MGLFSSAKKNGAPLGAALVIAQPKWKSKARVEQKRRERLKDRRSLENFRRPENQMLARLPGESISFLSAKNFIVVAVLAAIVVMALLVVIRLSHRQTELGIEISRLTKYQVQLKEENRRLKIEMARLASLDDVENLARSELGMVSPSQGQIFVID
jgi:cell division protein FtsL